MKVLFVTYTKQGKKYKGIIKETEFTKLVNNPEIHDLKTFENSMLMEVDYRGSKNIIHD